MFEFLRAWCTNTFMKYSADGAEHWFIEGYYRGWLDHAIGNEGQPNVDSYDVPKCYRGDYKHGYSDGFSDATEDNTDYEKLREVVYDEPQF